MGTNSGDLPPTWPLPAQQVVSVGLRTMVVVARTKLGEGNGWEKRELQPLYHVLLALFTVYWSVLYMCSIM
ncbi:hypothetical protein E2C01_073808 [Portunus trituberculatus]|uniref:Uncharacterized protein n=1 Tax=Portunus trituberculatus TaxID=210409 RepID=A0A5B7I3Z7_PORTR|nr:hypothetical protein [Portunus trituberculatus]